MVLSDTSKGDIGWRKYLIAGWAFMECLLFGGLLYGWGSLVYVFKSRGIYADLCPSPESSATNTSNVTYSNGSSLTVVTLPQVQPLQLSTANTNVSSTTVSTVATTESKDMPCEPQDSMFTLCFTIGSFLFCVSCLVMGHINYVFGTRVTRIIAMVLFMMGTIMLALVSKEAPWLMFPGLSLIGIGGLPLLVTNTQVSNLFGEGSSSIVGLLCGGYDMSSAVQLIVKLADAGGFSYKYMYFVLTALHSLTAVSTFGFLPKDYITKPEKPALTKEIPDGIGVEVELLQKEKRIDGKDETEKLQSKQTTSGELPTLKSCVLQPLFISHVVWTCILQLRFYYIVGTLNPYLNRIFPGDEANVSYFTNVCFYIMMGGLLSSFLTGIVYDWQKTIFKDSKSKMRRDLMPAVFPLAVGSVLGALMSILVLIPVPDLLYLTFIVMTLCRSFLYSMVAAFISALFPSEYFGMLYGIVIIVAGVFSAFQFALFKWAEAYLAGPLHADIFLLCLVLVSFFHPGFIWWKSSKAEREHVINTTE